MTPGRYSVARDAAITALGRGTGMFVSLLAGIAVARVWGPEGKGIVSFLSAGAALAARLGALGIEAGVGHFLLVRRRDHGRCLGTIFASASGAGAALALVGACVLLWRPGSIGSVPAGAVLAQLAALPASFVLFIGAYVFFAFGKALSFSVFDASYRAMLLAAVGIAALAATTVTTLVILQAATVVVFAIAAVAMAKRWFPGPWHVSVALLRELTAYGSRYYVYSLARCVLTYGSLLVATLTLGPAEGGIFSIAVMLGEVVLLTASSIGLSFIRPVALAEDPWNRTLRFAMSTLWVLPLVLLALAAVARPGIELVYGDRFLGAWPVFLLLAPGLMALGLEQVIATLFITRGTPWRLSILVAAVSVAGVATMVIGARGGGLNGLAIATSVSQVIAVLVIGHQFFIARNLHVAQASEGVPGLASVPAPTLLE
jgi:lipopolysaccharide exporter